jgi:hypothetical protein
MKFPTICCFMASVCSALVVPGHLENSNTIDGALIVERQSVPTSGGVPLINTVNTWRSRYKLPSLAWDTTLAKYAADAGRSGTCNDSPRHVIQGSTLAQVISPGIETNTKNWDLQGGTPFGLTYSGAWLCQRSTAVLTNDNGVDRCALGERYLGILSNFNPGLSDNLTNKSYKRIGCAFTPISCPNVQGFWVCNLS